MIHVYATIRRRRRSGASRPFVVGTGRLHLSITTTSGDPPSPDEGAMPSSAPPVGRSSAGSRSALRTGLEGGSQCGEEILDLVLAFEGVP
jgi:hypothetical protein